MDDRKQRRLVSAAPDGWRGAVPAGLAGAITALFGLLVPVVAAVGLVGCGMKAEAPVPAPPPAVIGAESAPPSATAALPAAGVDAVEPAEAGRAPAAAPGPASAPEPLPMLALEPAWTLGGLGDPRKATAPPRETLSSHQHAVLSAMEANAGSMVAAMPATPLPTPPEAYWNAWFERGSEASEWLEANRRYDFVVDLSRYRYATHSSAGIGPDVERELWNNRDRKSVRFVVRPFSLDEKLHLDQPESILEAKANRLFAPVTDAERRRVGAFRAGELPLVEFAPHVQAAAVRFGITARTGGCAAIGVSVWDETGLFPLDHLVISVPIADADQQAPACGSTRQKRVTVEKGAGPLLRLSLEHTTLEPEPVASLHLFDTDALGRTHTAVFMVERNAYQESGGTRGLHAWLTETPLTDYLAKHLWTQIEDARRRAEVGEQYSYAQAAQELAAKLFSQAEDARRDVAAQARGALRRAVAASSDPVIVVRMATGSGGHVLLPLALLGARAPDPVVDKPLTVVEPLMVERYSSANACIGAWTLAIPEKLSDVDDAEMRKSLTGIEKLSALAVQLKTEEDLSRYVGDRRAQQAAEGLILLAHHADGYLWFANASARVSTQMLGRRFAAGSVAMLSACATAKPEGDHLAWIRKLNRQGVDAMVVSPFPVPAGYAARLAVEFGAAVQAAVSERRTPTFLELFKGATQATSDHFRRESVGRMAYDELALEFIAAGDTNLRLCARP